MKKILSILLITITFLLGTSNVFALDVSQVSLKVEDKSSTIKVIDEGRGYLEVNPKLEFNVVGDFITYKLVLKNNDGKKYKVESVTDNNTNEHIKVEYDFNQDMNTDNKTILITLKYDKKIDNSNTQLKSIKVTIKLIDEDDNTQNIGGGSNTDPGGNNTGGSTNNNSNSPQTGDNIKTHVWWLFISLIGLVLSIIYLIKNKGKKYNKGLLSILLLLTLIPTIVFASETKNIIFNINFENIKINYKHKVSFDTKGAGEIETQVVEDNGKATKPTNPIKEHYNFVKWLDEENSEFDFTNTNVTKDIKLSALWEKKEYTISYETDGGTPKPQDQKVKYNETFDEPSKPTKNHYVFKKWVDENNVDYDFSTKATRNITLTAVWDKEEYTITFETDGGTPKPEDQKVLYKDKVTPPTNPTKNKHDFDGWLDEQGNLYNFDSEVTKNMTLTAKWTELFTVTYETNGGTPKPQDQTVRKNGKFNEPQKPSKDHYNFERWYIDATFTTHYDFNEEVTSDKKLYANYTPIEYTITYKLNGGNVSTPNKDKYTIETDDFTLNKPTKDKAVFKGWKKNNETTINENVTITKGTTGNLEFEAIFNPIYTVTYDVNGGNAITPTSKQIENGEEIGTLPTPTKDHYDFVGWYIGNDKIESNHVVNDNITLVAKYKATEYTITYKLNGGTVNPANKDKYTIETATFDLINPTPPSTDKAFAGWTGSNGTTPETTVTINQGTTGNLEFEAIFKNFYTVTFEVGASNDTPPQSRTILDGNPIGTLPNGPKPIEFVIYGFDGWYVGDTKIDATYQITQDTTVVAKYVKKTVNNGIEDLVNEDVTDTGCATNGIGLVVSDDPDSNARYIGACPSNYVSFNGELWRIIGVFNGIDDGTGKEEKRTKIIRDQPLKTIYGANLMPAFDVRYENSDPYYQGGGWRAVSQWGDTKLSNGTSVNGASLQRKLNTDYLYGVSNPETTDGKLNSRWYHTRWNQVTTNYFDRYDATQSLNDEARSLIGDAVWKTGAAIYNGSGSRIIASTMYNQERSTNLPTKNAAGLVRTTTWTGKVGLVYPSDYLYSPAGSTDETRAKCIVGDASQQACEVHTWLAPKTYKEYTITPVKCTNDLACNSDLTSVWVYAGDGGSRGVMHTTDNGNNGGQYYTHRPVVYLKSNVKILSGTGEKTNPFIIGFSNE